MGGLIVVVVLVMAVNLVVLVVKKQARGAAAAEVATNLGFAHSTVELGSPDLPFDVFRGRSKKVRHEISDPHDPSGVRGFVHSAVVGHGDDRRTVEQTCALVLTNWHAPHVRIDRRGVLGRVARHLGPAATSTGDVEFDECWKVRSDDPGFARELVNERLRTFLRSIEDGWSTIEFELGGNHLLAHLDGCHIDRIPELIDVVRQFKASVAPG